MKPEFDEDTGTKTLNCVRNCRDPLRLKEPWFGAFQPRKEDATRAPTATQCSKEAGLVLQAWGF